MRLLLAAPTTPPPPPNAPSDALLQLGPTELLIGGAVALVLLIVIALLVRRRKPTAAAPITPPAELPSEVPQLKVELPPSEAEAERRRIAEKRHAEAERLAQQRRLLELESKGAGAAEKERLQAEARALKEREEEAKREEYRAKKAAEAEERERHKREQAEAQRLARELEEKAKAEEERRRQEEEAARQRKVAAEAGRTLAQGLEKTRNQGFIGRLNNLFGQQRPVDESLLGDLEEILFTADIGVKTANKLVELAREKARKNELSDLNRIKALIRTEVEKILDLPAPRSLEGGGPPHVVMIVGVNGAGKTTTIGKLAAKLTAEGKKVILAAGDTFRAAATEQLDVWAERAKAELVKGPENGDPSSVVFEALKKGKESGAAVVIADTAGRLHTKAPLMEELKKVRRVMDKALPGAPHEVLLVVDATTGQNAIVQAKQFHEAVGITAIALTKLDGTAKGGVIIGVCDELKIPVAWVGVGEKIADLRRFDPREFVAALFE